MGACDGHPSNLLIIIIQMGIVWNVSLNGLDVEWHVTGAGRADWSRLLAASEMTSLPFPR